MSKVKLLSLNKDDFEIQTFRGSGKGGQNRNKVETCVRIIHKATKISAQACEERYQHQNKMIAFKRLCKNEKFLQWLKIESLKRNQLIPSEEQILKKVEEMMNLENLKVEMYNKDKKKFEVIDVTTNYNS